ncbi:MAG: 7-cyano-7-deazaguanine synthase QueC [Phycisphaeraceae bacterium]|nr:7-cyano-7-deazaguanine synthase QueC [Phycisphaeraceae bacterium]
MAGALPHHAPAVVLLSGGLDSAVALAAAKRDGFACHAISFDYGQRHRVELEAAARIAARAGVPHKVVGVDLRAIGGSALTDDIDVPKDRSEAELSGSVPVTYVPARNLIFLSIAAGYAQTLSAWNIFIGVNSVDYSGYPDCRWPFVEAFARAANFATGVWDDRDRATLQRPGFTIHAPLINLTKVQIIRLGRELGVDFMLTHSCYDPGESGIACGHCDSCLIRRRGFAEAGVPDPTRYHARVPAVEP